MNSVTDAEGVRAALRATPPGLFAAFRDPWWLIGSAAAALCDVPGITVHDLDILCSECDASNLLAAYRHRVDAQFRPADDALFRSRFARLSFDPLPVEVMGGLEVRRDGRWQPVRVADERMLDCDGQVIRVPSLPEQVRLFECFGRGKDLAKAALTRNHLAGEGASHAHEHAV